MDVRFLTDFAPPQMDELRNSQARNQLSTATTLKELREMRSRIEGLTGKIGELESTNSTLLSRIRDLEKQVSITRWPELRYTDRHSCVSG